MKLELICFQPHKYCITLPFCNHKIILYSPPHSVAIELKELEDILGPFSEFGLLLGSQGIIGYKH